METPRVVEEKKTTLISIVLFYKLIVSYKLLFAYQNIYNNFYDIF